MLEYIKESEIVGLRKSDNTSVMISNIICFIILIFLFAKLQEIRFLVNCLDVTSMRFMLDCLVLVPYDGGPKRFKQRKHFYRILLHEEFAVQI